MYVEYSACLPALIQYIIIIMHTEILCGYRACGLILSMWKGMTKETNDRIIKGANKRMNKNKPRDKNGTKSRNSGIH